MITIEVDFTKCKGCFECESILPKFRTKYGGIMRFNDSLKDSVRDTEILAAAYRVKDNCPEDAIIIS